MDRKKFMADEKNFQRHETYNNYMNLRKEAVPQYPRIRHKYASSNV